MAELVLHDAAEDDFGNLLKPTLESDNRWPCHLALPKPCQLAMQVTENNPYETWKVSRLSALLGSTLIKR